MAKKQTKKQTKKLTDMDIKDLKPLVIPLVSVLFLIILSIISFNILNSRISAKKVELDETKNEEETLLEKRRVLSEFDSLVSSESLASIDLAFPEDNPALMMISQIKNLSSTFGLTMVELNVGKATDIGNGTMKVSISFSIDGPFEGVINFVKTLETLSPINVIENAEFINSGGLTRADISLVLFYSKHPTKLPAITEGIKGLTADETNLLFEVNLLIPPTFGTLTPQEPIFREDPFQ